MSKTDKIKAIGSSNRSVVSIAVITIFLVAFACMLPLYMQNRLNSLYKVAHELQVKSSFLKHDALVLELRINKLSALESLSSFAESAELGLNGLPQKVVSVGGAK